VKMTFLLPLCASAVLAFAGWSADGQTSMQRSADSLQLDFQAAMAAEDRGDLAQAETLLTALHKAHPGIFEVDESLGLVIVSREDIARALPLLEAAVRERPASDVAHVNLGAAYYQLHRSLPARKEFESAVRINPRNVAAQESLGRLWMEADRPDEAAKALLAAEQLKPEDADLKLDCVTALLVANRLDQAQKMLATVADAGQSARAQSLWGEIDEKQSKFEEAGKHFDRAVQLEPSEENAWELGVELLRHWAFEAAAVEFAAASAKFPRSTRLRFALGAALFGAAHYERAIPVFADLLESDPGNAVYAESLGISCNAPMQTVSPRCGSLVAYAQSHPANARAAAYAASLLMKQEDDAKNADLIRKLTKSALAANPKLPEAQFQMGEILQNGKDWQGSIPYLERAVALKPDFAQAHYLLARAYWRTGRKKDGDVQMELQKKFAHQQQEDLDRRLREMTIFEVSVHQ